MSARVRLARRGALLLGAGALGFGIACIIPDQDIQVLLTDVNEFPVRFVEGIPIDEAGCACDPDTCECPMPSFTGIPYYLDPNNPSYQFCVCSDNKVDEGRLFGALLFVEDQDELDGVPSDSLYAAALLDWDPLTGDSPFDYVAYRNYVDPRQPLDLYYSSYESAVIKRPRPYVRQISFTDLTGRVDLCNDAGRPVAPGYHTLTFIASDRPWFQRDAGTVGTGDTGDGDGDPVATTPTTLDGVPDIAAGATYDIQTYVFMCQAEGDQNCKCMEQSEG